MGFYIEETQSTGEYVLWESHFSGQDPVGVVLLRKELHDALWRALNGLEVESPFEFAAAKEQSGAAEVWVGLDGAILKAILLLDGVEYAQRVASLIDPSGAADVLPSR